MRFPFCNICLLFCLILAQPARAESPNIAIEFKGLYVFSLGPIAFGKMGIEVDQSASEYNVTCDISSTGLARMFANHESHTTVEATGQGFIYSRLSYETNYRTRKKARYVKLVRAGGKMVEEKVQPPDNRDKRPAVEEALKANAYDPLSFVLAMRRGLIEALNQQRNSFSLDVYDGRRLTQADFTLQGKTTVVYNKAKVPVIAVAVRRKLLAGFTASEIDDYSPKEPTLYLYFTDDARVVPIQVELTTWFGKITGTLAKECRTGESCLLGVK